MVSKVQFHLSRFNKQASPSLPVPVETLVWRILFGPPDAGEVT
jgi:hypothetical protein